MKLVTTTVRIEPEIEQHSTTWFPQATKILPFSIAYMVWMIVALEVRAHIEIQVDTIL